jgi:hypothetical protein
MAVAVKTSPSEDLFWGKDVGWQHTELDRDGGFNLSNNPYDYVSKTPGYYLLSMELRIQNVGATGTYLEMGQIWTAFTRLSPYGVRYGFHAHTAHLTQAPIKSYTVAAEMYLDVGQSTRVITGGAPGTAIVSGRWTVRWLSK